MPLMVMISTVALTGVLFVEIPKGFFPQQDTGLIVGIAEGAQNIEESRKYLQRCYARV
jgi:HAE1 family hydrophobic/amphiphilic exporter-1